MGIIISYYLINGTLIYTENTDKKNGSIIDYVN
jgi:hypothetical protein